MLAINPLSPFFPDYLSFIIYGLVTGGGLRLGRVAKRHVVLMMVYLPLCVFWLFVMWAFMRVQSESRQIWFFVGLLVVFMKPFAMLYALFAFIFERVIERIQEARQDRREQQWREQPQGNQGYQGGWSNADILAEQARREAEAKAYRARQQRQSGFHSDPHPKTKSKTSHETNPKSHPTPRNLAPKTAVMSKS